MKYSDPYLCGVALGAILLAALTFADHGLGASGAFATTAAGTVAAVAPGYAAGNAYFGRYLSAAGGPWLAWPLFEIAGVVLGGWLSAVLAGRFRREIERGPHIAAGPRLLAAFAGGGIMGTGAVFARGCTSGQALTGGSLLSVGSWAFMIGAFAAAYAAAPALRRVWQ